MKTIFLLIKENISVSHITFVLCDCENIYFFNSMKENNKEISLNQRNLSLAV